MKQSTLTLLFAATTLSMPINTEAQTKRTPAFPGAEGYGMYVSGGRGGKVYHVTTLEDNESEGSLRYAINQKGARTIVFDVDGTIYLNSALKIKNGDLTIAGQTAPGDGVCVADWPVTISAKNVIVRYMRFRLGNKYVSREEGDGGHEGDAFGGTDGANIIVDHCSTSFSVDECLSVYGNRNTTVQWCIASNSLREAGHSKGAHGYGGMMGGGKVTYHHNLLAHHDSRTPRFAFRSGDETSKQHPTDYRNNVNYNYGKNGCYGGEEMNINIVNNCYKPGPFTLKQNDGYQKRIYGSGVGTHKDDEGNVTEYVWGHYFVDGNVNTEWNDVTKDNWTYGILNQVSSDNYGWNATTKDTIKMAEVMPFALVTTHTAEKAFEKVVAYGGASLHRDEYDAFIISDVQNGTATFTGANESDRPGIIDSPDDIVYADGHTGWPTLAQGIAQADTDGDGIPDVWETANGLNPNDASDGTVKNSDGYTNLELYMNSLVADITAAQYADGEQLGEDIASTGELNPPAIDESTITIPSDDYFDLDKAEKNSDGSLANGGQLKEVDGVMTIDNARNGNSVKFTIYNSVEQAYNIDLKACTNRGNDEVITLNIVITDADETEYCNQTVTISKTGWTNFQPYTVTTASLPTGIYYLVINFANNNGKYTANVEQIKMSAASAGIKEITTDTDGSSQNIYNLAGQSVNSNYKGIVVKEWKKEIKR